MSAYQALEARFERIADIGGALAVLHWDRQTMMPAGGNATRADQIATLRQLAHELLVDPATGDLLAAADGDGADLGRWQAANVREMRRSHGRATAIPSDLVAAVARATARAEMVWRQARSDADFAQLRPALEEVVGLVREQAVAIGAARALSPYDALLDGFESGLTQARIDRLFEPLAGFLPGFLEQVLAHQEPPLPLAGAFPPDRQKALGERLMARLGFDFDRGRVDESLHPFCGGVPDDVRMTARYDADDATSGLMAVLHETGHALYNAGLPAAWRRQPVGGALGMAVHESQSLLIEMQLCRSPSFLRFLAPLLAETFGVSGAAFRPDNLYRQAIHVARGLIRVDADEVTYPLHVILRYRLEKALIGGDLAVAELPGAWADGMAELVGIRPDNHRDGCLQDIHWPAGAFGYFPCYTLGALMAAQIYQAATAADPTIEAGIAQADFQPLLSWLRTNIHSQGRLLETDDLLTAATGRPLELAPFVDHVNTRYLA